jgi:hypothetical protein
MTKKPTKFVMMDRVREIEHKFVRQWLSGLGDKAKFRDDSVGYYAIFESCPASMYLGPDEPGLKEGDQVRVTIERA